ncbi:MAG: NTP transferase domain-containing protein [Clostridia bacterium]
MKAIILAAGKGKRLATEKEDLPKVLRVAGEKPLLMHVLENLAYCEHIIIVVGFGKDKVMHAAGSGYSYAIQDKQLGTGHAVLAAEGLLDGYQGDVLVAFGDMPLIRGESFKEICKFHAKGKADCTLMTYVYPPGEEIPHYGRILRDGEGLFAGIREHPDCNPEERMIREVNVGVLVCHAPRMFECLKQVKCENAQKEYYLTDLPGAMREKGYVVATHPIEDVLQINGANTPEDLENIVSILKQRKEGPYD